MKLGWNLDGPWKITVMELEYGTVMVLEWNWGGIWKEL